MAEQSLFERIAFAYQWFFNWQVKSYQRVIEANRDYLGINRGDRVIDLGCGTAAFSSALKEQGYRVTGVDLAGAMVRKGRANGVVCIRGDAAAGLPFSDHSFDLVVAAFVVHGLAAAARMGLYREASRLSRGLVIFHDYNQKRRRLTDLVETLEGGNYFSFIRDGLAEMRQCFSAVEVKSAGSWTSWYICSP